MKKLLILLAVVSAITANLYSQGYEYYAYRYQRKYPIPIEFYISQAKKELAGLRKIARKKKIVLGAQRKDTKCVDEEIRALEQRIIKLEDGRKKFEKKINEKIKKTKTRDKRTKFPEYEQYKMNGDQNPYLDIWDDYEERYKKIYPSIKHIAAAQEELEKLTGIIIKQKSALEKRIKELKDKRCECCLDSEDRLDYLDQNSSAGGSSGTYSS
jgi:chromosome segregation ATPase